jgi:hypothetical protein
MPVANVPNAPVSNSLGLKNPDGGETVCVEDVTGCPPKVAIAGETNITMAKAVSFFIFVFLCNIPRVAAAGDSTDRRGRASLQGDAGIS